MAEASEEDLGSKGAVVLMMIMMMINNNVKYTINPKMTIN